jgi:hypothetical protein
MTDIPTAKFMLRVLEERADIKIKRIAPLKFFSSVFTHLKKLIV